MRIGSSAVARAVSIVLHPVASVTILVLLTSRAGNRLLPFIGVILVVAIPLIVFSLRQVRRGAWTHVDASHPSERHALFLFSGVAVLLLAGWFYLTGSGAMARGALAAVAMGAVAYALLRWIKLSLHMAFFVYAAVVLLGVRPPAGWTLLAAAPLLAWSRLTLERHTTAEVIGGTLLGAATAAIVVFV